jgi:glyoxylase-like metal-dependent hydrolase (beta-lactamase superfamily II)
MKKVALALLAIILVLSMAAIAALLPAHRQIRRIAPPLPDRSAIEAALAGVAGPVSLRAVNSATQSHPSGTQVSHPAYLLEWADGRRFLIDAGMEPEAAVEFGRPIEFLLGSDPAVPHGSVAEQLGDAVIASVMGIAFTHLHTDHTQGIGALCRGRAGQPLRVFQTPVQADELNHTTRPGLAHIEGARCAEIERLPGANASGLHPVPGFPGLLAIVGGGHTPGSTLYVAPVGDLVWVMAGDPTNFMESVRLDRPKAALYSYLIVPESGARLSVLRAWLRDLDGARGFEVAISHDLRAAVERGMETWTAPTQEVTR